jgi:hypothetical protein
VMQTVIVILGGGGPLLKKCMLYLMTYEMHHDFRSVRINWS